MDALWGSLLALLPAGGMLDVVKYILMGLGSLMVLGVAVVKLTPGKSDDEAVAKVLEMPVVGSLLKFLIGFSPIKPKEE